MASANGDPGIQALSSAGKQLVRLMQSINFGRIENLAVQDGKPVFTPRPRIIRELKIGGDNGARPERELGDFALKNEVRELFQHLQAMGNGLVHCIEIKHGLPFKLTIEEVAA